MGELGKEKSALFLAGTTLLLPMGGDVDRIDGGALGWWIGGRSGT